MEIVNSAAGTARKIIAKLSHNAFVGAIRKEEDVVTIT